MSESRWCELCRDHVEGNHYDGAGHKIGAEYGWGGAILAVADAAVKWRRTAADPGETSTTRALARAVDAYVGEIQIETPS